MKLTEIAKDYNLRLTSLTKRNIKKLSEKYEISEEDAKNNAYLFDDHIILGFYDDIEIKTAAFFHELGHALVSERFEQLVHDDNVLVEYEAWVQGLRVAKKYKYDFSEKVFQYILECTNSYYKDSLKKYKKIQKKNDKKTKNKT